MPDGYYGLRLNGVKLLNNSTSDKYTYYALA